MDPTAFDTLVRSFASPGSRRLLIRLVAALPSVGLLVAREGEPEASAADRPIDRVRDRTPQRNHQQRNNTKNKGKSKNKTKKPGALGCPQCIAGEQCCDGKCANTTEDASNCGSCGHKCAPGVCQSNSCCLPDKNHGACSMTPEADGGLPCCPPLFCRFGTCCSLTDTNSPCVIG